MLKLRKEYNTTQQFSIFGIGTDRLNCYVMLCYVMLCYVMLCYVMLCYVMLCYVMVCYVMLCYVMLYSFPYSTFINKKLKN